MGVADLEKNCEMIICYNFEAFFGHFLRQLGKYKKLAQA